VIVVCWSLADGIKYKVLPDDFKNPKDFKMPWWRFFLMPSARLFEQTAGQTLILPAGTYHYVCACNATLNLRTPPPSSLPAYLLPSLSYNAFPSLLNTPPTHP
jgi:hypothetical protein